MPIRIAIPEASAIRRLAASLATSAAAKTPSSGGGLDLNQNVRNYFFYFPWTGKPVVTGERMPTLEEATVGQYFSAFDWEGRRSGPPPDAPPPAGISAAQPAKATGSPQEKGFDRFFSNFFQD
ncbi:MAG: hypothetical protein RLY93_16225 [Sumerlaeia bacterium]